MAKKFEKIEGVFPPIPTPFVGDEVAYDKLKENLSKWNKTELAGYVVLGSNGEFPFIEEEEKLKIVETVVANAAKDKVVIVGTGCESTRSSIRLTHKMAELGADVAILVNPNYYKARMDGASLTKHYLAVAEQSKIPIMIYNVPMFTGINMTPETILRIASHPNVVGIKDTSGMIAQVAEIIAGAPPHFSVLAGSAEHFYPALVLGARGGILALANVAPKECVQIYKLYKERRYDEASKLQLKMLPVNKTITAKYGIGGLKAALELVGYYGGDPRLPLFPVSDTERSNIKEILRKADLL